MTRRPLPTLFCLLTSATVFAAPSDDPSVPAAIHHEVPDGPYVAVPAEARRTGPAHRAVRGTFVSVQVNVDALGQNIVGDAANEPSIAVDLNDSRRVAIGWRQFDTIADSFRQAGWGATDDGGATWSTGVIEPGIFRSDPVLDSDAAGNFYYNSLSVPSGSFECDVFRSFDGGMNWDAGVFASELYYAFSNDGGVTWSANVALSPPFDPHLGWPQQNKIGDYYDMVSENDLVHVAWAATFNGEQDVYYLRLEAGPLFADGFESGDSDAWSLVVP